MDAQRLTDSNRNIRLLLTDFSTPETSGMELARWFQSRFPEAKVLITTASMWELLCYAGEHEEFGILVKPFSDAELRRMVQKLPADARTICAGRSLSAPTNGTPSSWWAVVRDSDVLASGFPRTFLGPTRAGDGL